MFLQWDLSVPGLNIYYYKVLWGDRDPIPPMKSMALGVYGGGGGGWNKRLNKKMRDVRLHGTPSNPTPFAINSITSDSLPRSPETKAWKGFHA